MNLWSIIGNLTREPELREVPGRNGTTSCCTMSVAVNDRRGGETIFVKVTAWGALAENCQRFLTKGKKIAAYGRASVHPWTDKEGKPRAEMELKADTVEFLSSREDGERLDAHAAVEASVPVDDSDLPF